MLVAISLGKLVGRDVINMLGAQATSWLCDLIAAGFCRYTDKQNQLYSPFCTLNRRLKERKIEKKQQTIAII